MRSSRKSFAAGLSPLVLLLSGCLLGPDFMRPAQELPPAYMEPGEKGESFANVPWWDLFEDPLLQQLIREAIDNNKDLKIAAARVEQAKALLKFTRADQFPSLSLAGNANRTQNSDTTSRPSPNPINDFGIFGDLSFELDVWGKLRRATEAEKAALLSTEYAQRAVVVSLVSQVASTYFHILGLEDRLAIANRTVEGRKESTRLVNARFSKGVVPELDLNQAQYEEASTAADAITFERELRQAEHALAVLLGKTSATIPRGKPLSTLALRQDIPAGFPAQLLERRPDILSAEEAAHSEVANIGVAEAERLPSFNLLGFVGLESRKGSNFFDANSFTWSIGGALAGPLIDFGKSKANQEAAEASAKAAMATYEQTVIQAVREVEDALIAIDTSQQGYLQRERQMKAAANATRLSRARYDEGVTSYLEILDVERSLFSAELAASQDRELYFVSIVQLYKALGGGWQESKENAQQSPANP